MRVISGDLDEPWDGNVLWLLRECEHGAGANIVVVTIVVIGDTEPGGGAASKPEGDRASDRSRLAVITREPKQGRPGIDAVGEYEREHGVARGTSPRLLDHTLEKVRGVGDGDRADIAWR